MPKSKALLFVTVPALTLAAGRVPAMDDVCCAWEDAPRTMTPIREHFPKDRVVDHLHMRLEIVIPDMNRARASARQTLTVTPIGDQPVTEFALDAKSLEIRSVRADGFGVSHEHDQNKLRLRFDPPIAPGRRVDVVTQYEIFDPPRGIIWNPESSAWPGATAQIHTQGQPETNSYWFPCHDFPNERLTTEVIATVPAGFTVSSNGRLVSREKSLRNAPGSNDATILRATETWHWLQDKPHANYLVSLVVGKFDVVDLNEGRDGALPLPVYVPPGRGDDVRRTYGNTGAMVARFEEVTDEPYPWDRYAQLVVRNFEAGGMENTSATSMHDNAIFSESADLDHDLDGLIAHELGHQWFGDLITCNSWEHIWLNEGWATYMDTLWHEQRDGEEGYTRSMLSRFDSVFENDKGTLPGTQPMVSRVYRHPWETFRRGSNPYPKGASILHMLRRAMGDEAFFRGVASYVDRYKYKTVETDQFRRAMEEASGLSLEQFFRQWAYRPGVPNVDVSFRYDPSRRRLRFDVAQKQQIDADNPAFEFPLVVFIKNQGGPDVVIEPPIAARSDAFEVELEGPPRFVAVNYRLDALGAFNVTQSPEQWIAQLTDGPTLAARVLAARALGSLGEQGGSVAHEALRRIAASGGEPTLLRVESIRALAKRGAKNDLRSLATGNGDRWEVREAVSTAMADAAKRDEHKEDASFRAFVIESLMARATRDESLKVRNASMKGLASIGAREVLPLVEESLFVTSQGDAARQTAIDCLATLKPDGALRTVAGFAADGFDSRTRTTAIDAVSQLAEQDRDAAFKALAAQVSSRQGRVRRAATTALAELGDPRGIEVIDKALAACRSDEVADQLREAREKLQAKLSTASGG